MAATIGYVVNFYTVNFGTEQNRTYKHNLAWMDVYINNIEIWWLAHLARHEPSNRRVKYAVGSSPTSSMISN